MGRFLQRGWVVLAAGAVMMLFSGVPSAWGIFRKATCEEYGFSPEQSALVLNLTVAAFGVGSVAGGWLQDKAGPRLCALAGSGLLAAGFAAAALLPAGWTAAFYAGFCIPAGVGCAFLYPAVMTCAQRWYPEKRGLATGVPGVGFGLSGLAITLVHRTAGGMWGLRGSFWTLAVLAAVVCGGGSLLLSLPPDAPVRPSEGMTPVQVLKSKSWRLLALAGALAAPAVLLFSPRIVEMAQSHGAEAGAGWTVALGAAANAAGRLAAPAAGDRLGRKRVQIGLLCVLAALAAGFWWMQGWWFLAGYAGLCFCYSGQAALLPSFVTDLFGPRWAGVNYGLAALGTSAGSVAFPLAVDALGGGDLIRHAAACAAPLAGALCLRRLPDKPPRK